MNPRLGCNPLTYQGRTAKQRIGQREKNSRAQVRHVDIPEPSLERQGMTAQFKKGERPQETCQSAEIDEIGMPGLS
jgi:hypothetical protein